MIYYYIFTLYYFSDFRMTSLKRKSTKIDLQIKLFALDMFNRGNRVSDISKKIGYSEPTIKYWINHSSTILAQENSESNPIPLRDINTNENVQSKEIFGEEINESNMLHNQANDDISKNLKYYGTRTSKVPCEMESNTSPQVSTRQQNLVLLKNYPENALSNERTSNSDISAKLKETPGLIISPKISDIHSLRSDHAKVQKSFNANDNEFRNFKKGVDNCQEVTEELIEFVSTGKRLVNKASNLLYQLQDTMNSYEIRKKVKYECQ